MSASSGLRQSPVEEETDVDRCNAYLDMFHQNVVAWRLGVFGTILSRQLLLLGRAMLRVCSHVYNGLGQRPSGREQ